MIGCIIAMESEAEILLSQMEVTDIQTIFGKTVRFGRAFGKEVLVVTTGEGKGNAAAGACAAIAKGADVLLNFGVAGGLLPSCTEVAAIYLIEKVVQYDFDLSQLNGLPIGTLPGEQQNFLPLFCPLLLDFPRRSLGTGDRFNDSAADHALLIKLGCEIREMEAGAIAQTAKGAGVPLVSVKAISDVYGSDSTTEQFKHNLKLALINLKAHLPEIFAALDERFGEIHMNPIPSFQKNHDLLSVGLHMSAPANGVTTFDLRFKKPNAGDYLSPDALHTIEHLIATVLRNSREKEKIVYFGPMGCRTGFYLLTVDLGYGDVLDLLKECIPIALALNEIPGSKREECGNYLAHDLSAARKELNEYLRILNESEGV